MFCRRSSNEQEEIDELPQLPDALFLLESPSLVQVSGGGNDHASVVAAAMAESALRKRDLNGNPSSLLPRRPKLPRGNLPHSKNIPETLGNVLVPPQLKGRLVHHNALFSSLFFTFCFSQTYKTMEKALSAVNESFKFI